DQAQGVLRAQEAEAYRTRGREVEDPITLVSLQARLTGGVRGLLYLLVGAVLLVLLLGALNAATLLVAHVGRRRVEFGIRQALGASKAILYRQLVLECLLLALMGTAAGLVIAMWSDGVLRALLPSTMPRFNELGVDRATVLFGATVGVLLGVATGLIAGIRAARFDVARLHDSATKTTGTVEGRRMLRALVLAEMAVAFILATGTGLLARSLVSASQVDLGFRPDAVTTFRLQLPDAAYPPARRLIFTERLLEGLRGVPGVIAAGMVNDLPLAGQMGMGTRLRPFGSPEDVDTVGASRRVVAGDYFAALGVPLLAGRTFTPADAQAEELPLIVSEAVARRLAPTGSAVGMAVYQLSTPARIVGIVGDVRQRGPDEPVRPTVYQPWASFNINSLSIAVRSSNDIAGAIREVVRRLDPTLPVFELRTMHDIVASALAERRFALTLVGAFALFGVGLALFGAYAVASVMVVERTREIGIRVALGASRRGVLRLVLGEGMLTGLLGVLVGLVGAVSLRPLVASLLFGVEAHDPPTLVGVAVLMVGIATLGALRPALRASRVDPMVALREE
ncbi:MAG TPA: FtsX-like permease family protein, partial [Gemmatimonadaceae bacterium]